MERDATVQHDLDEEGLGRPRQETGARREADAERPLWPLFAAVAGAFLALAILIVGLAPTWAVFLALAVVGAVLLAATALAWGLVHLRRPVH